MLLKPVIFTGANEYFISYPHVPPPAKLNKYIYMYLSIYITQLDHFVRPPPHKILATHLIFG